MVKKICEKILYYVCKEYHEFAESTCGLSTWQTFSDLVRVLLKSAKSFMEKESFIVLRWKK